MMPLARTIPKLQVLVLTLAALTAPAYATISYTACTSRCVDTNGTYAIWQTAPGSAGLTFSMSPSTFAAGNLASGVYTDGSGTVFTGYNGASIDTLMSVSGSSLLEGGNGTGTGIEILLPANTYAFAMNFTMFGSSFSTYYEAVGNHNVNGTNFSSNVAGAGSTQFFAITSTTPLTQLFIGPNSSAGHLQFNDFEIGQVAPTPEISTVALIGSGLVLVGLLRRSRLRKRSKVPLGQHTFECGIAT